MQIKGLPRNIHKLYAYSRTQECLDAYRQKYTTQVSLWETLKKEDISSDLMQG